MIRIAKKYIWQRFSFPMFWCAINVKFHSRWGTKPWDQKQVTGNDCGVISGFEVSGKTDFCTFVPFLGRFRITLQLPVENDWEICFPSQLLPVTCVWSRSFIPHRKWNIFTFWIRQNTGKENRYRIYFVLLNLPLYCRNTLWKAE